MHAHDAVKAPYHIWVAEAGWKYYLLVALPSMVMGLQNATIADLADELVQYLVWFKEHTGSAGRFSHAVRASRAQASFRAACFLAGVWLGYFAGAALGAFLELNDPPLALHTLHSGVKYARQRALAASGTLERCVCPGE